MTENERHDLAKALVYKTLRRDDEDCYQVAREAFLSAQNRWDPSGGASLKTFAAQRMVGAIKDYVRKESWRGCVCVPVIDGKKSYGVEVGELTDQPADDDHAELLLDRWQQRLNDNERTAVRMYATGSTLRQIGETVSLTEGRVSQLLASAKQALVA